MSRYCNNINAFLTFSGKPRCERLLSGLCSDASRLSRFCKVPSSRSLQQRWSARVSAQSKANFFCKAQTRSPVGALPFPWHEKYGQRSLNEPNFSAGQKTHRVREASSGRGGAKIVKQHRVGWRGRASYSPKVVANMHFCRLQERCFICKSHKILSGLK